MDEQLDEAQNLEENLPMVNYIMLHRIYDLLTLIASNIEPEKTEKMEKLIKGVIQQYNNRMIENKLIVR